MATKGSQSRGRYATLRTARLLLRAPSAGDATPLVRMYRDRRMWVYVPRAVWRPGGRATVRRIQTSIRKGAARWYVISESPSGAFVGVIAVFSIDWMERTGELGYLITRGKWGNGYASEAASRVCQFAFRHLRLRRLDAVVGEGNEASVAILLRLGFRREGSARKAAWLNGRWRDQLRFGLLASEFRAKPGWRRRRTRRAELR